MLNEHKCVSDSYMGQPNFFFFFQKKNKETKHIVSFIEVLSWWSSSTFHVWTFWVLF